MTMNPEDQKREQDNQTTPVKMSIKPDRVQIEFLIEDLARQLIIDRGRLVANGCNGCSSCA